MKIIELKKVPKHKIGKIIKTGDVSPWPHEEATAKTRFAADEGYPKHGDIERGSRKP